MQSKIIVNWVEYYHLRCLLRNCPTNPQAQDSPKFSRRAVSSVLALAPSGENLMLLIKLIIMSQILTIVELTVLCLRLICVLRIAVSDIHSRYSPTKGYVTKSGRIMHVISLMRLTGLLST